MRSLQSLDVLLSAGQAKTAGPSAACPKPEVVKRDRCRSAETMMEKELKVGVGVFIFVSA